MLTGLTLYPDGRKFNLILFSVSSGFVSILVLVIILDFKSINIIFIYLSRAILKIEGFNRPWHMWERQWI